MSFDTTMSQEDLEISILHIMLQSKENISRVINSNIVSEHFSHQDHNTRVPYYNLIFKLIVMHDQKFGTLVNEEIFKNELSKKNLKNSTVAEFNKAWARIDIADADEDNLEYYLQELTDRALRSKLMEIPNEYLRDLTNPENDPSLVAEKIREHVSTSVAELTSFGQKTKVIDIAGSAETIIDIYQKEKNEFMRTGGVKVGFPNIDRKTNGFRAGQLVVILGSTGAGKSMTLLNWAVNAHNEGSNVLFFSWEMPAWQCVSRYMACKRREPYEKFKNFMFNPEEEKQFFDYLKSLEEEKDNYFIFVDQPDNCTIGEIEANYRQLYSAGRKPDVIFVDYIGNMNPSTAVQGLKDYEVANAVARELRGLGRRYEIPIISAQQINREGTKESRKKMESGDYEGVDLSTDQIAGGFRVMHDADYSFAIYPQFSEDTGQALMWFKKVKGRDIDCPTFAAAYFPEYALIAPMKEDEGITSLIWNGGDNDDIGEFTSNEDNSTLPKDFLFNEDDPFE